MTYARWVCITSFDRPVVPEVGIITATSLGSTSPGPRPSGATSNSSATSARVTLDPGPATAASTTGVNSGSVTTSVGATWRTNPASSASVLFGFTGTWTAPTSM